VKLRELNALPDAQAAEALAACCGSSRWVKAMLARRPFGSPEELHAAAAESCTSLEAPDWQEAFAQHPRIGGGEQGTPAQSARGRAWSAREQQGMGSAAEPLRQALAAVNREYEQHFGFTYIVCAAGKSAEELLALARSRLANLPDQELAIAALEQQKITRLRLDNLLAEPNPENS